MSTKEFNQRKFLAQQDESARAMRPVAMSLAIEVCKMGYSPREADSIIKLTSEQFTQLSLWYVYWNRPADDRQ